MSSVRREESLGDLFSDLAYETKTLVRQEIDLAKTEMTEKAIQVGKDASLIAAGGAIAYAGFLAMLAAISIGLGHVMGYGWAALLVAIVTIGIGLGLALKGRSDLQRTNLKPEKTTQTLKETRQWAREQTR